ncbi:MAG TPA: BamA/TamA family outer membrane protein [Chitinophagaceae bacterium]|nr:BamA/TamA family outer membrane protein [Chitinophagaceae bacterium]
MKRNHLLTLAFFLFLITGFVLTGTAQTDSASAPGSTKFKTNSSRQFWRGTNYRKEWLTPVKAPIINLATEKGGLKPVKLGGGKQSKTLRVEDPTGKQYSLRLIEKFITAKTLPPELQSQAAEDLVADGVSASYPYATLSVPILSEAAGVPYDKVKLVYIPDDPLLGEYRNDFKNRLAYFEERLPESVKKGEDTYDVVVKLKEDNDDNIDQRAVLRARILDMFIMDLDRHEDQWQWGAIDKDKGKTYFPIPRDRDQAFFTNQGVIPGIVKASWIVPQLEGFKPKAKNINRFNFAARNFDRFFLTELNEQDWKKEVDEFIPKMTDEVIERAINEQPKEIRSISGDKIIKILKERRKYLAADVMQYYRFLSEIVSVSGSDKKELFDITRTDDGSVSVQVYKITKEGQQSTKMYDRTFDPAVTKEIRLYSFGGEDKFLIKGNNDKIKVRMIGGDGKDIFENTGSGGGNIVYDMKKENNKLTGDLKNKMANDTIVNSYNRLDYKYNQTIPMVLANYNSDDGVILGFSVKFINQGFRKTPYKNMHEIGFAHAISSKAFDFRYAAEYYSVFGKKTDLLTYIDIKAPNSTNFFGYGDNSIYDKTKPGEFKYYRARYNTGDLAVLLRKRFSEKVMFTFGPAYQYYSMDSTDNVGRNIVTTIPGVNKTTLFAKQSYLGGRYSFIVDTRNNKVVPTKGIYMRLTGRHLRGLNDISYDHLTQFNGDFTFHLTIIPKTLILVDRVGGGHNFGDFEFYQAQYLGGEDNLRGYRKYRFAGRSKVFNNTELRWRMATFRTYLFPAYFGLFAFYDTGKIWLDDSDSSNGWLSGYGGGVWIAPLSRLVLSVSYTASKEDKLPIVSLGWKF